MSRVLSMTGVAAAASLAAWFSWPRPDAEIEVDRGGVAHVIDRLGRRHALEDTVFVGGAGSRRSVRVINRDSVPHQLALFSVKAGEQMEYVVPPGTFGGFCSAHATKRHLTIVVR
jgi:hypothetical protein